MKKNTLTTILLSVALTATAQSVLPYQNPNLSPEQRAADLIGRLTVEEKAKEFIKTDNEDSSLNVETAAVKPNNVELR